MCTLLEDKGDRIKKTRLWTLSRCFIILIFMRMMNMVFQFCFVTSCQSTHFTCRLFWTEWHRFFVSETFTVSFTFCFTIPGWTIWQSFVLITGIPCSTRLSIHHRHTSIREETQKIENSSAKARPYQSYSNTDYTWISPCRDSPRLLQAHFLFYTLDIYHILFSWAITCLLTQCSI
jgi:hypothetical protein